jgi:hypothetical protein
MDLRISIVLPAHGPGLALAYMSCGDLNETPSLATSNLQSNRSGFIFGASGELMIQVLRRLHEPVSDAHLRIALALAVVALSLMLWAILWQANIIVYQRDLIRVLWNTQLGGTR